MILYINNEHCTSLEQLKGCFREDLTPDSNIYADLQDYGRVNRGGSWNNDARYCRSSYRNNNSPDNTNNNLGFRLVLSELRTSE